MASYNVTGGTPAGNLQLTFTETPAGVVFGGNAIQFKEQLRLRFGAQGSLADQIDGLYYAQLTFVASTPQTLDLTTLTDPLGNSLGSIARVRFVGIKVNWTTNGVPLIVGGAGANEWNGFLSNGGTIKVYPSSANNDGFFLLSAPQTTAVTVSGTSKLLKLDPQTAAGTVDIILGTCSA
jgi:hypothetical protein